MKKNKIIINCTIFFMCAILTSVVFMQFKTAKQTNLTDIENMNEEELKKEIISLQNRYKEIDEKLNETKKTMEQYNKTLQDNEESSKLIDSELEELKKVVGKTDVEGNGVILTLENNEKQDVTANVLLDLVNELKFAGAEAISINEIRIVNMTDIVDVNYIVQIEGQKISSPYIVKCIGDEQYLDSTLNSKNGFIETYKNSGISIKMQDAKNIIINKYTGNTKMNYGKEQ